LSTQHKRSDIVSIHHPKNGPAPERAVITQRDLAEVALMRKQIRELRKGLEQKRFLIRHGLENGALIEPGMRTAKLKKMLIVA
jgi:hypothetical protein